MNRRADAVVPGVAVERTRSIRHSDGVTRSPSFLAITIAAVAVAGCVPRAAPPVPVAVPTPPPPVVAPPPVLPADWQDWPWTPGAWRYLRDTNGTRAVYAQPGQPVALQLRCDRAARAIWLERPGAIVAPFTIRTTSTTRTVATQAAPGASPQIAARFAVDDRLLDAMAFTRGRFTVEQPGTPPLVLPPWAEIGRVIEDCRA